MIFYHNAAKISWDVVFDFAFAKVKTDETFTKEVRFEHRTEH